MGKTTTILLAAVMLLAPTTAAAHAAPLAPNVPTTPTITGSKYVTVGFSKRVFKRTYWQQSAYNRNVVCNGYRWDRRNTINRLSRATIQSGYWPARNVKKGVRRALRQVC